jgi:hypothetical protein
MEPTEKIEVNVVLHDGTSVPETFYNTIFHQIESIIDLLTTSKPYTAAELTGEEYWSTLSLRERLLAGKCLSNMVKSNKLPLQIQGCEHKRPRKYVMN